LRTLGETGLLGFVTFYGTILIACYCALRALNSTDRILAGIAAGYFAGTIGLLINAVYIDVFASSKVALTYWCVTGLLFGYYVLVTHTPELALFDGKPVHLPSEKVTPTAHTEKARVRKKEARPV
jgi:hypothetical protein